MAAPASSSSSVGAKRDRASPAPSSSLSTPGADAAAITRWDRLLPLAQQAAEQAALAAQEEIIAAHAERTPYFFVSAQYPQEAYLGAFKRVIFDAFPDLDIEREHRLVYADADMAWRMRGAATTPMGEIANDFFRLLASDLANGPTGRGRFVHRLRRLSQYASVWDAILQQIKEWMDHPQYATYPGIGDYARGLRAEAAAIFQVMQEVNGPAAERGRFDASQIERHMSMAHRVPAGVTNLIGQFATAGITNQTPIPLRLQVKHKLELLTRRVAYLSPAQVAAEMRDILGDVEEALPEDERVLKKARK